MRLAEIAQYTLKEGGNAIKSSVPINQENVAATMNEIERTVLPKLGVTVKDTASLGSTGKKGPGQSSGDVDLAVSAEAIVKANDLKSDEELMDFVHGVAKSLAPETMKMGGMKIVSLAWPITNVNGEQEGEVVQLDLMLVGSIDWARWAYHAPAHNESQYKGLYRNEIMYAIASFMDYTTIARAMDKAGEEVDVEWKRHFFDLNKGLMHGEQSRYGAMNKKTGLRNVKAKAGSATDKVLRSQDPKEVVQMFFGPNATPNGMLTWEQAFGAITSKNFVYAKDRQKILDMTRAGIEKKGYPVPPELEKVT